MSFSTTEEEKPGVRLSEPFERTIWAPNVCSNDPCGATALQANAARAHDEQAYSRFSTEIESRWASDIKIISYITIFI